MKKEWYIGIAAAAAVVLVLIIFNYQGSDQGVSLSEIFPEAKMSPSPDIEYEFVDEPVPDIPPPPVPAAVPAQPVKAVSLPSPVPVAAAVPAAPAAVKPPVPAAQPAVARAPAVPASGSFAIQIASFKDKAKADSSLKPVLAAGHPAYVAVKDLGEKGTWYRIYIGPFETKAQADAYLGKVSSAYQGSFIISVK